MNRTSIRRRLFLVCAMALIVFTGVVATRAEESCLPGASCCGSLTCSTIQFENFCSGDDCGFFHNCCTPSDITKCCIPAIN